MELHRTRDFLRTMREMEKRGTCGLWEYLLAFEHACKVLGGRLPGPLGPKGYNQRVVGLCLAAAISTNTRNEEIVRECVQILKERFVAWRTPPVELPTESVIEDVVREILKRRDETNADDAARYRFLFTCEDFLRNPLWPVVDWMRGTSNVPKEDVDAALDEAMGEK